MSESVPDLQKPGAGLPPVELFVAKNLLFPFYCMTHDFDKALLKFEQNADALVREVESIALSERDKPVLIKSLPGIEDSSRYWSSSMVLEHLIIVGDLMAHVIESLAKDKAIPFVADVAAVKPPGKITGDTIVNSYREFSERFVSRVAPLRSFAGKTNTYDHPWFGPINLHKWVCLSGLHEQIHLRQISEIKKGL